MQIIRLLPKSIPIFAPDLPGYGLSSPVTGDTSASHTKRAVGNAILAALSGLFKKNGNSGAKSPTPILLVGHDRGARVAHHLAIDASLYADKFTLVGTSVLDIVPTIIQWQGMANPAEGKGFFHWPLLANVDLATEMIQALGGDIFLRRMFDRWRGTLSPECEQKLGQDGAYEIYEAAFRPESVIRASCLDYAAGAKEDIDEQKADQAEGKKVGVPILVLYSASGLGKRFDVPGAWKSWVHEPEKNIVQRAVGGGAGHFFAEENPEETFEYLIEWFKELGIYESK